MAGKLSIVATPIGNLEDITFRAIRTLSECDVILAEDTRTTIGLLKHYQIPQKETISFFEGNEERKINFAITLLGMGKHVVLVSESGTPLLSDPGFKLVRSSIAMGINVETIPGPSALVAALTVSGIPTNTFVFLGFLPRKSSNTERLLRETKDGMSKHIRTVIFYESPHRIVKSLHLIKEIFGDVEVAVSRELTKLHEETLRGSVVEVILHFEKISPRVEFTVVFSR